VLLYAHQTVAEVQRDWPKFMAKWSEENNGAPLQSKRSFLTFSKKSAQMEQKKKSEFRWLFKPTSIVPLNTERKLRDAESVNLFYIQVPQFSTFSLRRVDINSF
jgi:hypothetical protein